jgi:hypothetical protein
VAGRKRDVEELGRPQTFLPWKTTVYGLQLVRHGRGNPDTDLGGNLNVRMGLGAGEVEEYCQRESHVHGEGRDGSTQPAQDTSAGHCRIGAPEANLPAGYSQQSES